MTTRRLLLPGLVLLALALALAGTATAPPPPRLPAVALGSLLVWRAEVAASVFVAAYVAIVAVRLSLHGRTFTRVGSGGVQIPELRGPLEGTASATELEDTVASLATTVAAIDVRLRALEHARDVLLRSDRGGLA